MRMRKPKANEDIRTAIRSAGLFQWEVAAEIGIAEITFLKWMRFPLPDDKKKKVLTAILKLSAEQLAEEAGTRGQDQG